MSYILEALKKSEQERERERGTLPDIKSIHAPSTSSQKEGRAWWPFVLLGVVLVTGAGITVFYFNNSQQQPVDVALLEEGQPNSNNEAAEAVQSAAPAKSKSAEPKKAEKPVATKTEQNKSKVVFSKQRLEHDDQIGNIAEQREQRAAEQKAKSTESSIDSVEQEIAIPIAEIPDDVRQHIPRIAFEGHVYSSTPTRRSVMINGHKMREGDAIGENLLLKEITPEGAEFEYKGYRFKLNALQDWSFN